MSSVRLTRRAEPPVRVDLSALRPEALAGMDAAAIERLSLGSVRAPLAVGELFRVQAGDAPALVIEGGSSRFDALGAGMTAGSLVLEGDAGCFLGRGMHGGRLAVRGSVGAFAASGLRGGVIEIAGDAGDFLGGAAAGERTGMVGGTVVVRGSAGARAADRMRRGLMVIEGTAGAYLASHMIAGTVVCARAGAHPGTLMRRGTVLLGDAHLPPTFVRAGLAADSAFLRLLARALRPLSAAAAGLAESAAERFVGDMATLGKGEIFLAENRPIR
jgi:formylmethanofuran dehydrogenase subunit C